jgi:hypothetical protein
MEVEVGASWSVVELKEKVAALQKEKTNLEASLASVRIRAETSTKQLEEARGKAQTAKETAKAAEDRCQSAEELVGIFRQAVADWAFPLQVEIHRLLERFSIDAPPLAGEDANSVELIEFFQWLRCCMAMVDCGSQLFGELNADIAARSLMAAVCSLLEAQAGGKAAVSKTKLRTLRDPFVLM